MKRAPPGEVVLPALKKMSKNEGSTPPQTEYSECVVARRGRMGGRGVWDGHVHTAVFRMDDQ